MPEVWRITPEKIQAAIDRVVEACNPKRIILFGSGASGKLHRHSDLDLLVDPSRLHLSGIVVD